MLNPVCFRLFMVEITRRSGQESGKDVFPENTQQQQSNCYQRDQQPEVFLSVSEDSFIREVAFVERAVCSRSRCRGAS